MSITKTVKTGWGTDKDGNLFAPKTLVESIQNKDGKLLTEALNTFVHISEDTEVIKNVVIEVLKTETLLSKTTISTSSGYATNSVTFLNNLSNYDSVDFKVYYNDNYILTSYKPTDIIGKSISAPGPENNSMKMNITDTGASGFDCYYNMSLEIIGYRKE